MGVSEANVITHSPIGEQTAARRACQNDAAENYSGSRTKSATENFYHKEHKETIEGRFAAEASKKLENVESRFVPLVRGRVVRRSVSIPPFPLKSLGVRLFNKKRGKSD